MTLVGPFQFRTFYDSNCIQNHTQMTTKTGIPKYKEKRILCSSNSLKVFFSIQDLFASHEEI